MHKIASIKTFLLLQLLVLVGCSSDKEKKAEIPPNILSEETFTKVLADFALSESANRPMQAIAKT